MEFKNKTQRLLILFSRLTLRDEPAEIIDILSNCYIDWYELLSLLVKHKTIGLAYLHIRNLDLERFFPKRILITIRYICNGIEKTNKLYLLQLNEIAIAFLSHNTIGLPLKGAYLLGRVYTDISSRQLSDLDILIRKSSKGKVSEIMKSLGFCQGEFDKSSRSFKALSREKSIMWKTKLNNMYPFKKISKSSFFDYFLVDFCFSLDLRLDSAVVDKMIDESLLVEGLYTLDKYYFFIHLCAHLYKEASNAVDIQRGSAVNLIKFCDVREFFLISFQKTDLKELIHKINDTNQANAVFYSMYFCKFIFNDGHESEILSILQSEVDAESVLNEFGSMNFGFRKKWTKTFSERIFATSNYDQCPENLEYNNVK
jgi:hypothetical protein